MTDGLTWNAVGGRRLERSLIAAPSGDARPADVAAAMCGTHAQLIGAAEVSIALRMESGIRRDVQAALWTERSLVKTYGLRGTVHLFATRDLPMWTAALAAVPSRLGSYPEGVRLTDDESRRIVEAMATALADSELTADELEAELVLRVGAWTAERSVAAFTSTWPRWRLALYDAVAEGLICFGANRGSKVTWTSVQRLVPGFAPMNREEAVRAVLRAYLRAYGPSTPEWFARWIGAPKRWGAEAFASLGDELTDIEVEGTRAWLPADDLRFDALPPRGVRLLPYFDAFTIAWQPRELMFPGRAAERALAGGQAGTVPVLVVDGVVTGVWRQRRTARKLVVAVEPFAELRPSQRDELDAQVAKLGDVHELPAELSLV